MNGRDSARGRVSYRLPARFAQRRIACSNAQQLAARAGFNAGTHPRNIRRTGFEHGFFLKQCSLAWLIERLKIRPDAAGKLLPSRPRTGTDVQYVASASRVDCQILAKGRGCREQRQNRKNQPRPAQFRPPDPENPHRAPDSVAVESTPARLQPAPWRPTTCCKAAMWR